MKTLVGTAVLMAALTTGGIPVVMSTVAQTDRAVDEIRAEQAVRVGSEDHSDLRSDEDAEKVAEKTAAPADETARRTKAEGRGKAPDKPAKKSTDKLADGKPGYGPPDHARSVHNRTGTMPGRAGRNGVGLGPVHGKAMRAWAACVSKQPGKDAEGFDPESVCGAKPTPPGHLRQERPSPRS